MIGFIGGVFFFGGYVRFGWLICCIFMIFVCCREDGIIFLRDDLCIFFVIIRVVLCFNCDKKIFTCNSSHWGCLNGVLAHIPVFVRILANPSNRFVRSYKSEHFEHFRINNRTVSTQ